VVRSRDGGALHEEDARSPRPLDHAHRARADRRRLVSQPLWIDRQKCLLLTHTGTLFSIFRPRVRAAALRPIGSYLTEAIESELCAEGLPSDTVAELSLTRGDWPGPRVAARSAT
jgi:hypothetical protein